MTNPLSDMLQPRPQKKKDSQLRHAARAGHTAKVQSLIAQGANVNAQSDKKGYTAVHEAVRSGSPATLHAVLTAPNVNVDQPARIDPGMTPLHLAAVTENPGATQQLLEVGANPLATVRGTTPEVLAQMVANTAGRGGLQRIALSKANPNTVLLSRHHRT